MAGKSAIIIGKLSDHFAVCCFMDVFRQRNPLSRYVFVQENSARAHENFVLAVESSIQNTNFNSELLKDPNENYNKLHDIISECKTRHLPFRKKRFNKYKHKLTPWATPSILASIKYKDNLYKTMKLAKPDSKEYHDAKINLNSFSNNLKRDIRLAKSKYYHDRLNKFKSDSRKTWNIINDILWRNKS